jgi:hypothetical protein
VHRLLVSADVVPSSPILVTLMKEALSSFETSVPTRATRRNKWQVCIWVGPGTALTEMLLVPSEPAMIQVGSGRWLLYISFLLSLIHQTLCHLRYWQSSWITCNYTNKSSGSWSPALPNNGHLVKWQTKLRVQACRDVARPSRYVAGLWKATIQTTDSVLK